MVSFIGVTSLKGGTWLKGGQLDIVPGYDIFLVAGQSNTLNGEDTITVPDPSIDGAESNIFQLGRFGAENNTAVPAAEPLDHYNASGVTDKVGFALAFAKKYKQDLLESGRDVLLVPCGYGNTGFSNDCWNSGDFMDLDARNRTDTALALGSGTNVLKGVLWHQGETDAKAGGSWVTNYQTNLLALIDRWRTHFGDATLPFIVGGFVPAWADNAADYTTIQNVIQNVPNLRTYTGYADPASPTELVSNLSFDAGEGIHFDAPSQRGTSSRNLSDVNTMGLAGRYYTAYLASLTNV